MLGMIILLACIVIVGIMKMFGGVDIGKFFGGGGAAGGGAAGSIGISAGSVGIPIVDSDYRENDITAADTWTGLTDREGTAQGGIDVPASPNQTITSITISWAGTASTPGAAGEVHSHFGMRMSGSGLKEGGSYRFLAGGVQTLIVGTGDICGSWMGMPMTYPTNIQCKSSGKIDLEGIMMGEDLGTVTMTVILTFGPTGTPGGYIDGDFREVDLTAINSMVAATAIGAVTEGDMEIPEGATQINGVVIQGILDPGTSAATVGLIGVVQLTGSGLAAGGTYRFSYVSESICGATGGVSIEPVAPQLYDVEIGVKAGQKVQASATFLGADPGAATVGIGFLFR